MNEKMYCKRNGESMTQHCAQYRFRIGCYIQQLSIFDWTVQERRDREKWRALCQTGWWKRKIADDDNKVIKLQWFLLGLLLCYELIFYCWLLFFFINILCIISFVLWNEPGIGMRLLFMWFVAFFPESACLFLAINLVVKHRCMISSLPNLIGC